MTNLAQKKSSMRVLYISYTVPWNPKYGGTIRSFGIVSGLSERSDLHVALASSKESEVSYFNNSPIGIKVNRHILKAADKWGDKDDWAASRSLRTVLGQGKFREDFYRLVNTIEPDLIWYSEVEALRRAGSIRFSPQIIDFVDVRWLKLFNYSKQLHGKYGLSLWLKSTIARIDDIRIANSMFKSLVAGPQEAQSLWPVKEISVVPNGYDFPDEPKIIERSGHDLIFIGSLFYLPNRGGLDWFCKYVWPIVRLSIPDATFNIVGLGGEELGKYDEQLGIRLCGWVDDLDPLIKSSAGLVVPLKVGGGTRIKILEAWAKGLPVVSTSIGGEGLGIIDGDTALIGNSPEELAGACVSLLRDPKLGMQLAERGFAHGKAHFDWPGIHKKLGEILASIPT